MINMWDLICDFFIYFQLDQELPDEETTPCYMKDISIKT